ncbi:Fe-S protein assembly co-chaperone HscB [Azohydromonas lata]|uniref:Co-chaperone protein HscB homolog n=1 Tax=Azohydromonas lata TaxID=45677 RepID=A0ABU5IC05_9BURK|nr:Fe-S protein assembly co-chaperone HscB [Azohydromonas lata]MDZ5456642.1 Fe-S protein assembly co-chaperone HscB [Azohydromonas lata]
MNLTDDDFTLFGLPQKFALDRTALDACWRQLQARVHPDRFAAEGATAQRLAMQWSVRVNEAYRRLRDPLTRAAYLCELRGAPIDAHNNTAMPAAFLMQQMEWRETLEEADAAAEVESLDDEVRTAERALLDEVRQLLDERGDAATAAQRVRALMFVARFREDIEARLDALGQ